jgi:NAD(P)-dependent dehydrogenase (short-subunit alcohol dehydrogenase family)
MIPLYRRHELRANVRNGRGASTRVALVTGGSTGIGAACVSELLASGWKVCVAALPGPELDRLAADKVLTIAGDITSDKIRAAAVEQTVGVYGRIDVLLNNAGIGLYALPTEMPAESFRRLLDVNVMAPLGLAQLVIPLMHKQASGTIVNVGSVAGCVALPWAAAYCASKSALHAVHDCLRRELRGSPIHLIKVCPGIVDTRFREHALGGTPPLSVRDIRRVVSAELVARRIVRAIERRTKTVYVPRIGAVFALAGALAPGLMDLYLGRLLGCGRLKKTSIGAEYGVERS